MSWWIGLGVLLLVVVLFSGWLLLCNGSRSDIVVGDDGGKDYVLYDFQIVVFDEQGKEFIILCVLLLECICSDVIMNIIILVFLLFDQDGNYWELCSDKGWVSVKGEQFKLIGNVSGDSLKVFVVFFIMFCIDYFDVFFKENCVSIDVKVIMICLGMMQFGVGFELDFKIKIYCFFSQFKGSYMFIC